LYNLWYELPAAQRGSDTYQGEWGTLMQLIVSRGLFDFRGVQYVDGSFAVAKFKGLNMDAEGAPLRWDFAGPAGSGFSDHFPVVARFTTVADGAADRYLPVKVKAPDASETASVPTEKSRVDVEKLAVPVDQLPAGAALRSPEFQGQIIRVEGRVGAGTRLTVEFRGEVYDVWSFDAQLRKKLRETYHAGDPIRFYGELGLYKQHWQFVIREESWVK
ncbi:MAG: Endonuclease/exonuclease/phosphatase, partial [Verrucomicrobia bacterium]|nr:Endonuclease/exonuclease/phosphatase [Verrucomicrobiota bacterium]